MKKLIAAALLLGATAAQAHEVWIERDGSGPARIYLGEPAETAPEGGDPEFANLKAPKLLPASTAPQVRKAGYIEVAAPAGDVRAWDDAVFAPWGDEGKKEGVVYFARAGRAEARATMPFELAPVTAGGNRFALTQAGKPLADTNVTVVTPDKWSKTFKTDAQGVVTLPIKEKGRYLLSASAKEEGDLTTPGGKVVTLHKITTTTFVAE